MCARSTDRRVAKVPFMGARPSVMTTERLDAASKLRQNGQSYRQIGGVLGVGASTVRKNPGRAG